MKPTCAQGARIRRFTSEQVLNGLPADVANALNNDVLLAELHVQAAIIERVLRLAGVSFTLSAATQEDDSAALVFACRCGPVRAGARRRPKPSAPHQRGLTPAGVEVAA